MIVGVAAGLSACGGADFGPLAIVPGDSQAFEGELHLGVVRITDACVTLIGASVELTMVWPEDATRWSRSSASVTYEGIDNTATIRGGDRVEVGGVSEGRPKSWVNAPDESCPHSYLFVWGVRPAEPR